MEKSEMVNGVETPVDKTVQTRYAGQAMKLLEEGKFTAALQLLNLCLGETDETEPSDLEVQVGDLMKKEKSGCKQEATVVNQEECCTDESSLIEKRCLVNMRLKRYSKVVHDAKKMLDFSGENAVAYKCLLAALCKMKKLEQVNEVIRLWQKNAPRDLDMMECRTKLENLMVAVKNGIEASDAFSDVEDLLGLNYDWLLLRKSKDPQWKYRPLPTSSRCSFVLCLQYRFGHCSLGEKCPDAHGEGELEEWKRRFEIENVSRKINSIRLDDGMSYVKNLLAKLELDGASKNRLNEDNLDQLKVSCNSSLHTTVQLKNFKKFTWKFTVKSAKPLTHVALLYELHRQYFHISSCSFVGPNDSVMLSQTGKTEPASQVLTPQLSEAALAIAGVGANTYGYKIKVAFTPDNIFGTFRQTVVFDGGDEVKLIRNIVAEVVPPPDTDKGEGKSKTARNENSSPVEVNKGFRNNIPWNFGNADMVDGNTGEKVSSEKLGFALMSSAKVLKSESFMENKKDPLSKDHYKERMRFLLTQEERARQEILAKYNVTTTVHLSEKYVVSGGYNEGMTRYAIDGALFGRINLFRDISEDTAVGRLILRSCNAVLLAKSEESRRLRRDSDSKIRVYFCPISDKTKNSVFLDIGKKCVAEMDLKDGDAIQFDIQFQLDRTAFIEQKKVIDQLEERHLDMLFPDLAISCNIPWNPIKQWSEIENSKYRLNPKQKEALIAITAENCKTPPILVIGPFGSGKTFTLAQCIRKILTQENTRVMVCTHSNSAADLYIKEYLDSWVKEGFTAARPLRIYYEMRNLSSVHPIVLQYCTVEAMKFRPPTYDEVMKHRVIVVTLSTSYLLMQMNLPEETFSHILLDEAAQAMESEAITPLMSAGENTKLVLAGDHFQLSPELFSEEARNIHPSLLERLHALYSDTHPCKLMLCENYRSHSAIIQFVSESFYTKKLECAKSQPVHDSFFPLTFFAARGEDVQDSESTSYYNMAEVFELTEKISQLISSWPEKWGDFRDENAIGVLTPYADQVTRIRSRLRKKGLHSVSVERVFNVQGKQFRAVFLSTVRTFRPWVRILPEAVGNEVDLGFFSSPKLLNTALTRAQSLVAVVGDPVSLCSVGKCRRIWEDYIRIAHENKSLFGITFLQLKESILGVEMRLTWGLNPLANEFQPQRAGNKVSSTVTSTIASITPASIQGPGATVSQGPTSYGYNRARPVRPPYLLPDPMHGAYYGPVPYAEANVMPPPHPGAVPNPAFYQGIQPPVLRPPYGGYGMTPTAGIPPHIPPVIVGPWNQSSGPSMPFQPTYAPAAAMIPAAIGVNVRPVPHGPMPFNNNAASGMHPPPTGYPNPSLPVAPLPPPSGSHSASLSTNKNEVNSAVLANQNYYAGKNFAAVAQSQYATGQPLYRRPNSSNTAGGPVPALSAMHQASAYEDPTGLKQLLPPQDHLYNPQTHQKLTPEELNFITRALEQQASSGEPFYGDIQSLRMKLLQNLAVNSSEVPPSTHVAQGAVNAPKYSAVQPSDNQFSGLTSMNHHQHHPLSSNAVFAPIPQKSPITSLPSTVRETSLYGTNSVYHNHEPATNIDIQSIWSNSNNAFPTLNDGLQTSSSFNSNSQIGNDTFSQRSRKRLNLVDPQTQPRLPFNQGTANNPTLNFPPQSLPQHGLPNSRPLTSYNNNSILSTHNEYGYHAEVGGLKAQLSGGIQQAFGDRSAFSRVNGGQDVDIVTDNSGLGRSYANVVKAAVTAAVGAGVSTSTISMPSTNSRPQNYLLAQGHIPNPAYTSSPFPNAPGAPIHRPFGP